MGEWRCRGGFWDGDRVIMVFFFSIFGVSSRLR